MLSTLRSRLLRLLMVCALVLGGAVHAQTSSAGMNSCAPQLLGSWGAKEVSEGQRPTQGWQSLVIPHSSAASWPDWQGAVWYRLDWQLNCTQAGSAAPGTLALAISGIRLAGTVYWNDGLLWSDRSLVEPFSRSWNIPRWWPVFVQDTQAVQTVWLRVVAARPDVKGLGYVKLGNIASIRDEYAGRFWRQRTSYVLTAGLSLTIACVAMAVWMWRRSEKIYLWMGLMQLFWTLYLSAILSLEPWPGISSNVLASLALVFFMLYGHCFASFVLRFHAQKKVHLERALWALLAIWVAYISVDSSHMRLIGEISLIWGVVVFNGGCIYAIYRALRTREPQHLLLGAACAVMVLVAAHDIEVALRRWDNDLTWSYFSWPLNMLVLAVLLGWQVASHMRRVDGFNVELTGHVEQARAELARVLAQQHAKDLTVPSCKSVCNWRMTCTMAWAAAWCVPWRWWSRRPSR